MIIIFISFKYALPTLGKGIGPSFSWVGVGLLSLDDGSWARVCVGVCV